MNITLNNYEAYFLDYHEGSLSPALVNELMNFIAIHPELKEEFESFEYIPLQSTEEIIFDNKDTLKKPLTNIDASNFEEYAIEYMEGTLPDLLQQELFAFIGQNRAYQRELELYAKTKLVPDTSIIFDNKSSLKKESRRPVPFYYWSAAATIAVIIGVFFLLNKSTNQIANTIVKHDPVKDTNMVTNHTIKSKDTNLVAPKSMLYPPLNNLVKKNAVANNMHGLKHENKGIAVPVQSIKDTTTVVVNQVTPKKDITPAKNEVPLPAHPSGDSTLPQNTSTDDGWVVIQRPIKKKAKNEKALAQIAAITCQGLHTITGQHIELRKQFGSDTAKIIAYQLDLGNKKFEFPVKE